MQVRGTFNIRGRGKVFCTTIDESGIPDKDIVIVRLRDGLHWPIKGVDRFARHRDTLQVGENAGFLVGDDCSLEEGDFIGIITKAAAEGR